jgi:histidinol-phosphatase (PHP family)
MLFNLHTHTHFSDGSSEPEAYIEEAIRQGFHTLGFSDHSPVPFENSFALTEEKVEEYVNAIRTPPPPPLRHTPPLAPPLKLGEGKGVGYPTILLGLEIDYIPGITKPIDEYRKMNVFDYYIGSVHLVRSGSDTDLWFIDGPDIAIYDGGLARVFKNDVKTAVSAYYRQINAMLETQRPDILGHFDKIRMYNRNRYFREEEKWYQDLIDESLEVVKKTETIVEVNTRGIYKKRSDALFPGIEILKKIKALDIPVIISSDAHKPEELSYGFDNARRVLIDLGFTHLTLKTAASCVEVPLS